MMSREEKIALAGQERIMMYLARNEGVAFNRAQLCAILEIHPETIDRYIQRIRSNAKYNRYFRTTYGGVTIGKLRNWRVSYHYAIPPAKRQLCGI